MAYLKSIVVTILKRARIRLRDENIINSAYLSDFNITSFTKLINDLTGVVNNRDDYLYWGQEQIMINSGYIVSTCFNEFD